MPGYNEAPNPVTMMGYDPTTHLFIPVQFQTVATDPFNQELYGQLVGGGGGGGSVTQYTSGQAPPANPIGDALVYSNGSLWVVASSSNGFPVTVLNANANGQQLMVNSAPVVIASDQTPVPTDTSAVQGPVNITTAGGASGGTSPTFTGTCTATADNLITFASKVRKVELHNQSGVNVPFEHDIVSSAISPYLAPGQLVVLEIHTTSLHVFPPNALPINAANGLIVRGWL